MLIGGGFYAFFNLKTDVRIIRHDQKNAELRIEVMSESMQMLTTILTKVAVQDERFNSVTSRIDGMEEDIREMKHWKGFISPNGEWGSSSKKS